MSLGRLAPHRRPDVEAGLAAAVDLGVGEVARVVREEVGHEHKIGPQARRRLRRRFGLLVAVDGEQPPAVGPGGDAGALEGRPHLGRRVAPVPRHVDVFIDVVAAVEVVCFDVGDVDAAAEPRAGFRDGVYPLAEEVSLEIQISTAVCES